MPAALAIAALQPSEPSMPRERRDDGKSRG